MTVTLLQGDCIAVLKTLPDNSVDSIVTDPPYGLEFMGKEWDAPWKSDTRQTFKDEIQPNETPFGRSKVRNGMGASYNSGVMQMRGFQDFCEEWATECFRVLKPGGHMLAFSGSRTYHRMTTGIEDAGFEIRDQIMWVYGSGFPKSLDVSKAIDKAAGAEREVIGQRKHPTLKDTTKIEEAANASHGKNMWKREWDITGAVLPEAKQWQGWGTALKPAHEPICVARKPLEGTVAANVLKHGVGGLNIDGCRVETNPEVDEGGYAGDDVASSPLGRFPANFIHDGSDEVVELFPDSKGQQGDVKGNEPSHTGDANTVTYGEYGRVPFAKRVELDKSAARFFYCAKTSKKDRNHGLDDFEEKAIANTKGNGIRRVCNKCGAYQLEPCDCVDNEWVLPANKKNNHPTVKPTDLMRYLCKLVTPPNGTVLDPFTGSGSTGRGAVLEGFNFIGIELSAEYIDITKARIAAAEQAVAEANKPTNEIFNKFFTEE